MGSTPTAVLWRVIILCLFTLEACSIPGRQLRRCAERIQSLMSETKITKGVSTSLAISGTFSQNPPIIQGNVYDSCGYSVEKRNLQCKTIKNMAARTVRGRSKNSTIGFLLSRDKKEEGSVLYGSS